MRGQRVDDVTLRDYLECRITALKDVLGQRLDDLDKATLIRAADMYRRLEELNHAQDRADRTHQTYLPREIYEKSLEEWRIWRGTIDQVVARAAERKTVYAAIIISGLTFLGIVITTVLRILGK